MKADKCRKLEAAGGRVGSADDFLGLSTDESRQVAAKASRLPKLGLRHYTYGGDDRAAWLVVADPCAGRRHVYTVYRISLTANKYAHVIGRELDLPLARKIVKRDMESLR